MQTARERANDIAGLRHRYEEIYDQALNFMHGRRGASFAGALAQAMVLAGLRYLQQFDRMTFKAIIAAGQNTLDEQGAG